MGDFSLQYPLHQLLCRRRHILEGLSERNDRETHTLKGLHHDNWKVYQSGFYMMIEGFNPDNYVFYNFTGCILSCSALSQHFKQALQECNLPDIRIHDLRHSYATLLLLKNISPKVASGMLGHSDSRTTLDIYSHLLTDMQKPDINALNDTFKDITVTKQ